VLKTPMLSRFIAKLRAGDREQASAVLARVREEVGDGSPHSWSFECDVLQPGMFFAFFQRIGASPFRIDQLLADPTNPGVRMRVTPLMLEREGLTMLLPALDTPLKPGDCILFAGDDVARRLQQRYLTEPGTVAWVCSGSEPPRGFIFRWLEQRRRASAS
jgi:voltage-gated potassium channel